MKNLTVSELLNKKRLLCAIKHKSSKRRITKIEREIGKIKKELNNRRKEKLFFRIHDEY